MTTPVGLAPRRVIPGIRDLASLSKTLARNRKSCTGVAATKRDWNGTEGCEDILLVLGALVTLGKVIWSESNDTPA
jgi:hypothetical protein